MKRQTSAFASYFVLLALGLFLLGFARESRAGSIYVAIVGASEFTHLRQDQQLPFVNNDVAEVQKAFKALGCDGTSGRMLVLSEKSGVKPTKNNIETEIVNFFQENVKSADDVAVIFVSSHGVCQDGETYLVARDSQAIFRDDKELTKDSLETMVKAKTLRGVLENLPTENVLLILDACHSGASGAKTRSAASASYFDVIDEANLVKLTQDSNVATFASCAENERSYGLKTKEISFFTNWLVLGLKGGADANTDGVVASDELFAYVKSRRDSSLALFGAEELFGVDPDSGKVNSQKPVIVLSEEAKPFHLGTLKSDLYAVENVIADEIVSFCEVGDLGRLKTTKFYFPSFQRVGEPIKGINKVLQENVLQNAAGMFHNAVADAVKVKAKSVGRKIEFVAESRDADFTAENKMRIARVDGALRYKATCKLVAVSDASKADVDIPEIVASFPAVQATLPNKINSELKSPDVRFVVNGSGEERKPIVKDGALWVELNPGETYVIKVKIKVPSSCPDGIGMKLLVDGRDTTRPRQNAAEKRLIETKAPIAKMIAEPDEDEEDSDSNGSNDVEIFTAALKDAKYWVLPSSNAYMINGYQQTKSVAREFKVEKLDEETLADPKKVAESSFGLFVFEFLQLEEQPVSRGGVVDVTTTPGDERESKIKDVHTNLLAKKSFGGLVVRAASHKALVDAGIIEE